MQQLEALRTRLLADMEAAVDAFPWEDPSAYGDYLAQTFFYSQHSVRLLGAMLARSPSLTSFSDYCVRAIHEELRHDELALRDLEALGQSPSQHGELGICRLLWEPQYYKAEHVSPESVCGYILMLESLAVTRGTQMQQRANQPDASRFFAVHIQKDDDHTRKLLGLIGELDDVHEQAIAENMQQTAIAWTTMLAEIRTRSAK